MSHVGQSLTNFCLFWLHWAFPRGREQAYSSLQWAGFSFWWLICLWSPGSRAWELQQLWHVGSESVGSVVAAHGLSCSETCGIFQDQGSNLCPLVDRWILGR